MNFKTAIKLILKFEGGYVDDPLDPGGETKFGISKRSYPNLDIANLTKDEAKAIYKADYWDKLNLDLLPPAIRLIVFDAGVNHGTFWAAKALQSLANVKLDGHIGPITAAAIGELNARKTLLRYAQKRKDYYFQNRMFFRFGRGWIGRLLTVLVESDYENTDLYLK